MTRTEFIENITTWYELLDFCSDEGCDWCENVYSEDAKDEHFDYNLVDMARNAGNWQDLLDTLNDIPTGYDYYILDDYGDFRGADDDDFDSYKNDVLEWGDDHDIWEDEEEEAEDGEEEEVIDEEEDDGFPVEEGCSIGELFASGASCLQTIAVEANREKELEESAFQSLFNPAV